MLSGWGSRKDRVKYKIQETVTQTIRFGFLARSLRLAVPSGLSISAMSSMTQVLPVPLRNPSSSGCHTSVQCSGHSPRRPNHTQAQEAGGIQDGRGEGAFTEEQSLHSEQTLPQTPPLEISSFSSLASARS